MNELITANNITMSTVEISELTGKRHDNVMRKAKELEEKGIIRAPQIEERYGNNNIRIIYRLNKTESLNLVANLSPEFTAKIIDRWQELENSQPALPQDYPTALRLYADEVEKRMLIEGERDHAIATKAEIGTRREATAMATASKEKRRAAGLEVELDKSKEWITVKRAEMLCHGQKFNWRELKAASAEMGYEIKKVFDENYGSINAYHKDVWLEAYALTF